MKEKLEQKKIELQNSLQQQGQAIANLEKTLNNANRNYIALEGALQAVNELLEEKEEK